jgi:hypothetical protein
MRRAFLASLLLALLTACASDRVPPFAARPYAVFNRADTVAIALREWRLFGAPVDDASPAARPEPATAAEKPERQPGLWQRVGEYWWIGQDAGAPESAWTGKHDARGAVFPFRDDGHYAWSAAFISYVMRVAGAGDRFPYAPNHATYVNAAAAGASPILKAWPPELYAPKPGDLVCRGRYWAAQLTFRDLPTRRLWPGHCSLVVEARPGMLGVIGGNVDDAVTLTHVPITAAGMLARGDGTVLDARYRWFVVLQVLYDAEAEPRSQD